MVRELWQNHHKVATNACHEVLFAKLLYPKEFAVSSHWYQLTLEGLDVSIPFWSALHFQTVPCHLKFLRDTFCWIKKLHPCNCCAGWSNRNESDFGTQHNQKNHLNMLVLPYRKRSMLPWYLQWQVPRGELDAKSTFFGQSPKKIDLPTFTSGFSNLNK